MTGFGPLELAGAGFVFGIAAGGLIGLLSGNAFWPIMAAGALGIVLVPVAARWRPVRRLQRFRQGLAPRTPGKA